MMEAARWHLMLEGRTGKAGSDHVIDRRSQSGLRSARDVLRTARKIAAGLGWLGLWLAAGCAAHAQDIGWAVLVHAPSQRARPEASPLSRPQEAATITRETSGTAFFVDGSGHMLTARHAADNCARLLVLKEGRTVAAQLVALSANADLAIIKVPKTLGLAAVFPNQVMASANDMVFASAYDKLQASRGVLANATIAANAGEAGALLLDSDISFGASGAPVLDGRGLVQGIVSRRIAERRVLAVGAAEAKSFLAANGVAVDQDDRSQIAGASARADRAASISARVICVQN
jgi:S1-C subfamily serine protease